MGSRRVLVLHNTDYDDELDVLGQPENKPAVTAGVVCEAAREAGFDASLVGVNGRELGSLMRQLAADPPDLVFNLVESLDGSTKNEHVVASVLDLLRVPFTGADALGLQQCVRKDCAKLLLLGAGVPTPESMLVTTPSSAEQPPPGGFPCFLKLSREDASIGIDERNIARTPEQLITRACELLAEFGQAVLVERYIEGREVNVSLLGEGDDIEVLPLHEIDFDGLPADRPHIVSYAAKWDAAHVDYNTMVSVPLRDASPGLSSRLSAVALAAYRTLGLRDYGRVDLRVDREGRPWVIDVNPNADLWPESGMTRAARAAGLTHAALVGRICESALRRHRRA